MSKKPTPGDKIPMLLVSYMTKVKPPKNVILLSTTHTQFKVNETYSVKPNTKKRTEAIEFYNTTMGTVDRRSDGKKNLM